MTSGTAKGELQRVTSFPGGGVPFASSPSFGTVGKFMWAEFQGGRVYLLQSQHDCGIQHDGRLYVDTNPADGQQSVNEELVWRKDRFVPCQEQQDCTPVADRDRKYFRPTVEQALSVREEWNQMQGMAYKLGANIKRLIPLRERETIIEAESGAFCYHFADQSDSRLLVKAAIDTNADKKVDTMLYMVLHFSPADANVSGDLSNILDIWSGDVTKKVPFLAYTRIDLAAQTYLSR